MADDTTPDGAAERVRAFIDRWTAPDWLGRNDLQRIDDHELTIADLRALLDEREQLRDERDKLETLRGQLGAVRQQWALRSPKGSVGLTYKAEAMGMLAKLNPTHTPVTRLVGEWREAEEGGEPT